mmetsp:Transcript_11039/g.12621  ORF Transcript_11039/g.12621 Transcript_11039/m.12621 type:complete len:213 (-) Transcript_11039:1573-2211(-)
MGTAGQERFIPLTTPKEFSRLLYPNPVCLLVTGTGPSGKRLENEEVKPLQEKLNVMTLTWLTPVNNLGGFVFSINKRRFTSGRITSFQDFMLSIPTKGMERLVLELGKKSGRWCDKVSAVSNLEFQCREHENCNGLFCSARPWIKGCCAHLDCKIIRIQEADEQHYLVSALVERASVHEGYWNGKNFAPADHPPYLTFLGSQKFAYVTQPEG